MKSTGFNSSGYGAKGYLQLSDVNDRTFAEEAITPSERAGWKIIFYDLSNAKLGEYDGAILDSPVESFRFDLLETGCGSFQIKLAEFPSFTLGEFYRVDIHLYEEAAPRFRGRILVLPNAASTDNRFTISGHGYYDDLEICRVNAEYEGMEISAIVKQIMTDFIQPNTAIVYNATKIQVTNPAYKAVFIKFDRVSAKDALAELIEYAGSYQAGVDAAGELFFRPINPDVITDAIKWAGKHITTFQPKTDCSDIINEIDVLGGELDVDGSNFVGTLTNAASQTAYGPRWAVRTIPSSLAPIDTLRWGLFTLNGEKDPVESAKAKGVELFNYQEIIPNGLARVYDKDGNTQDLPVKKIEYSVSANKYIVVSLDLGKVEFPAMSERNVTMFRRIKTNEALERINNEQLA